MRDFLQKYFPFEVPKKLQESCVTDCEEFDTIKFFESLKKCLTEYESIKDNTLASHFRMTAKYWPQYCNLVSLQQMLHYTININDFDLRQQCREMLLPHCFVYRKVHGPRYGSFYICVLENMDTTHLEVKEELKHIGISIRRNTYKIGQTNDMKSRKTAGGITIFFLDQKQHQNAY